jgi:hypothetical protein
MGQMGLVAASFFFENARAVIVKELTVILIACLIVKIILAAAAFAWGMRRSAITTSATVWIIGGWLVLGLFLAGCQYGFCGWIHRPDLRVWTMLGAFLILPLADLAIAPLALAWNRHR